MWGQRQEAVRTDTQRLFLDALQSAIQHVTFGCSDSCKSFFEPLLQIDSFGGRPLPRAGLQFYHNRTVRVRLPNPAAQALLCSSLVSIERLGNVHQTLPGPYRCGVVCRADAVQCTGTRIPLWQQDRF